MSTTLPAFHGKFGNTEVWIVTMKANQFISLTTIPREIEGWDHFSPEEKFQREINYARIVKYIAPYLAEEEDRFIGEFIVEVRNHEEMIYKTLLDAGLKTPPGLSENAMKQFGLLELSGGEILVPLDGQHRLKALEFAISGKDERGRDLTNFSPNPDIAKDTCTVILIRHDLDKARKIFNKVNKYAKPTSKADNLITDDTNYIAVISREEIVGGTQNLVPSNVVKVGTSNTLNDKDGQFTTLATVYEICHFVESARLGGGKLNLLELPAKRDYEIAVDYLTNWWKEFLKITPYENALSDPSPGGDEMRADIRRVNLACKPIAQRALAEAIVRLTPRQDGSDEDNQGKIEQRLAVDRINQLDWDPENELWQGILRKGNSVIAGNGPMKFASRMIAYLLGEKLEQKELDELERSFKAQNPKLDFPDRVFQPE